LITTRKSLQNTHTQTHLQIISETLKYAVVNATPEIQITANHTVKLWCLRRRRNNYPKKFHITNNLNLLEKTQETTAGVQPPKKDWKKDLFKGTNVWQQENPVSQDLYVRAETT
jgi:hypothetical protein